MGLTFKEDCPDLRNTRVVDIIQELESYEVNVLVHDPLADPFEAEKYYGIHLKAWEEIQHMDAIIIATAHKLYKNLPFEEIAGKVNSSGSIIDVKSILDPEESLSRKYEYWRL